MLAQKENAYSQRTRKRLKQQRNLTQLSPLFARSWLGLINLSTHTKRWLVYAKIRIQRRILSSYRFYSTILQVGDLTPLSLAVS